jgi:uncharacterized Zn finger protein
MKAYAYQAALHCESCGLTICAQLDAEGKRPANVSDEYSFDSDDYPKGPFADGGGESDSPSHCDTCGKFLENPLTRDGEQYVKEAISADGKPLIDEWREFYSYLYV